MSTDRARRQRLKLAVMILIFGPIVVYSLYHLGRGAYKIYKGEPVGYRDTAERYKAP